MANMFDIQLTGDKELARQLGRLTHKVQTKVIKQAFRKSLGRIKDRVLLNLSGAVVRERTGRYVNAMESQPIRTRIETDGTVVASIALPGRAALGIDAKDPYYYPTVVEYGVKRGKRRWDGKAPIRKAVNAVQEMELKRIGDDIGTGIAKEASRK